jgi:hypothetical protein
MKNVSGIAAIALVSSLGLLAAGCDRNPEPGEQTAGEHVDNAVAETKQESHDLGNTLERKADQAGQAIDDAAITTSIKAKYLADDTLKGHEISVETDHGKEFGVGFWGGFRPKQSQTTLNYSKLFLNHFPNSSNPKSQTFNN